MSIATEIEKYIDQHLDALRTIPENEFAFKPSPSKWSKKEIIGHLVDSAMSNIRRFIIAQYEYEPHIVYKQDNWVSLSDYQNYNSSGLIQLWYSLNKHIVHILKNIPVEYLQRKCKTEDLHTLQWLAEDYLKHLKHHLHQVLQLEPIAYP
jgi:hypothetical protein